MIVVNEMELLEINGGERSHYTQADIDKGVAHAKNIIAREKFIEQPIREIASGFVRALEIMHDPVGYGIGMAKKGLNMQ